MANPGGVEYRYSSINTLDPVADGIRAALSEEFDRTGFVVRRGLFTGGEIAAIRERFDRLAAAARAVPGYWEPDLSAAAGEDPLRRYPRVMMPHRWDALSKGMLLDVRVHEVLAALWGEEPVAAQSMYYFKPPGARGQALHQDNFYLQVKPGTCLAAWTAIDPSTPENGGLYVVPGTHDLALACPEMADERDSFVTHLVRVPTGRKAVPVPLAPGDTLFFNGSLIHGSAPNRSADRWRRAFIGHYIPRSAQFVSKFYFPLVDFQGREVSFQPSTDGGPCGSEFQAPAYGA